MDESIQLYVLSRERFARSKTDTDKGPSQISRAEADRLPKKTLPIPDDPDHYIVQLSVLHNLHCLVRALYSM